MGTYFVTSLMHSTPRRSTLVGMGGGNDLQAIGADARSGRALTQRLWILGLRRRASAEKKMEASSWKKVSSSPWWFSHSRVKILAALNHFLNSWLKDVKIVGVICFWFTHSFYCWNGSTCLVCTQISGCLWHQQGKPLTGLCQCGFSTSREIIILSWCWWHQTGNSACSFRSF